MRVLLLLFAAGLLATLVGCKLKGVLPGTAVLNATARGAFEDPRVAMVDYTGEPLVPYPVVPFQVFGVRYAVDIVLVTQHPDWDMHEYARLDLPDGSVWVAKDADQAGVQTITSDLPDLESWLPEVPVRRVRAPLAVTDRSEGNQIDITLAYTNPAGEPVEVQAKGRLPKRPPGKRNGNTMGHSRDIVAAVLDLERFGSRLKAQMRIGDRAWGFQRLLGVIPFKFLLSQTQGGFAIADYRLTPGEGSWKLTRPGADDADWPTQSEAEWLASQESLNHDNGICQFRYAFTEGELHEAAVKQINVPRETFYLWLQPALPDLRRPFEGIAHSKMRMDVGGQAGHGTGDVTAQWVDARTVVVDIVPTAPHWLADRPLRSTIRYEEDGSVHVRTERIAQSGSATP